MTDKPKFKQTEVGLIPSDWEVKSFGELFNMCTANISIKDVNQEFYVGTENMLQNKMGVVKNTAVLPYSKVREYQKNDILVSNIRPYLKKIWFADKNGGCSTDVLVFRVKDKNQSPSFLYNVVADDRFFNIVNENAIGTKMPRGDKNVIKQILFAVPSSKAEQTAIANALSDVDTLIANLEKLIAKKKNIKQGAMQQLLTGKKRLPGFGSDERRMECHSERSAKREVEESSGYKMTELGMIPTDWEVKKIGDFTKLQAGGTPSTLCDEFWGGNIRWMNSGELNNKRIYDVAGRITELGLNNSSTHLIPSKCVLVGLAGQGKTRGTAAINYVELCTNQSIAAMFPSKTHNSEYLYHTIDNRYEELRELSSGDGGRGGLNLKVLANLFVALPSKAEQTAIANVLGDMDTEISALETKLAKYRTLKTGMMQQLLTGKIRLV